MNISKETRRQRALDLRAFLGRNSHLFSLKDVCEEAGIKYESTANAIHKLVKNSDPYAISDKRLTTLEETALFMSEKLESQPA